MKNTFQNADEAYEALLDEVGRSTLNRSARFCCAIAYLHGPSGQLGSVLGVLEGTLATELRGEHGFGYDPIFIPKGYDMTLGEMRPDQKRSMSHRYLALMAFKERVF